MKFEEGQKVKVLEQCQITRERGYDVEYTPNGFWNPRMLLLVGEVGVVVEPNGGATFKDQTSSVGVEFSNGCTWYFHQDELELMPADWVPVEEATAEPEGTQEYTGSSVSYYSVLVANPTTEGVEPYTAECNDIIEALGMNYAEGNLMKAIWRRCAARKLGKSKKGYDDGQYDAEKMVFFAKRILVGQNQ